MPTAELKFNLPEEEQEFQDAVRGSDYKLVLWEVAQEIFRPARKHGYSDHKIATLLAEIDSLSNDAGKGEELIGLLEEKFYEMLQDRNLSIE